jgi:hypothetical protein
VSEIRADKPRSSYEPLDQQQIEMLRGVLLKSVGSEVRSAGAERPKVDGVDVPHAWPEEGGTL